MLPELHVSLAPQTIVACAAALGALAAVALPLLLWRTDFSTVARRHLRRWAPLHLTLGPPAVVYLAACGLASLSYHFWYVIPAVERGTLTGLTGPVSPVAATREQILSSWEFHGFYMIEWACSLVGAFACAGLVRWLGLSRAWVVMVIASLSVFAIYRTAACHVESTETSYEFTSGPEIRSRPDPIDAVPVFLGFALCAIAAHVRAPRRVVLALGRLRTQSHLLARRELAAVEDRDGHGEQDRCEHGHGEHVKPRRLRIDE